MVNKRRNHMPDKSKKKIGRLHCLTQDMPGLTHEEQALQLCMGGARWIQLRVKKRPHDEWLQIARSVTEICHRYDAVCIINDNVAIAKEVGADGVHLGKTDMSPLDAWADLGEGFIIGSTANTLEDIIRLKNLPVDYIGLGPFRYTETKKNLSPVLGLEAIKMIVKNAEAGIPIIAIGGIRTSDIAEVMATGVHGIAVSGALHLSGNIGQSVK
jgi:thiamine-phosphate pyrophosphorylase